jgi:heme exporter protein A
MQPPRLAAHDLACRRGDRVLLRGISFALEAGQALQLAGPNGIGKSSLMRVLAGLARPCAGRVEQAGRVGLLDERPALDEHQPLGRALGFWGLLDPSPPGGQCERLGLADLLDVPVRYLSTGQRKRAALARLLGQDAPLWLLDEPLNGLDQAAVSLVEELVMQHCAQGGLAIIASHQPITVPGLGRIDLASFVP